MFNYNKTNVQNKIKLSSFFKYFFTFTFENLILDI